jgi:acyl-CoA reductase-like NAD-dependent aldehyde dehydrogenase
LTALLLGNLALEAGLPAGVLNVLPGGPATGKALAQHAGVDKVGLFAEVRGGRRLIDLFV